MATTRRQFIKQSAAAFSAGLLMPRILFARGRRAAFSGRRILVVVQLSGGNDGLNTVIPYKDPRYLALRPALGFREEELKDDQGGSMIIGGEFGLHPRLKDLKRLYDDRRLAIVMGAGYPNPDLSHSTSTDIWQTAMVGTTGRLGWLGRYTDLAFDGKPEFSAVAVGSSNLPRILSAQKRAVPLVNKLGDSAFVFSFTPEFDNFSNTLRTLYQREFPEGSFKAAISEAGRTAEKGTQSLQDALAKYTSTVVYPDNNPVAAALKTVAVLASGIPDSYLFHVAYPSAFDTHSQQIDTDEAGVADRLAGIHADEMLRLSEAIKSFNDDMIEQGLGGDFVLMTYSEFGRRPGENASLGTDHGSASNLFVVGSAVRGGQLYGAQPSLNESDLDTDGNMRFTTDFRSVYATILDNWLGDVDSERVLGEPFAPVGFL
jgi:uncharacterized protein (DUF1501 family)